MKLKIILTTLVLVALPQKVWALESESISNFHSQITVNTDGSLEIAETINYTTTLVKHGIYRYIPENYAKGNQHYTARVRVKQVLADFQPEPYQLSRSNGNLQLKIGSKNITFTGDRTYTIVYTVDNAATHTSNHEELSWDIVGEGWEVPIASVSATISLPASPQSAQCYGGDIGSDDGYCSIRTSGSLVTLVYPHTIEYGQNVTTLIKLPLGSVSPLTGLRAWMKWVSDNWPVAVTIAPLLFWVWYYHRHGRDYEFISPDIFTMSAAAPQRLKALLGATRTPFVYEPLHLTPGEAGAVLDESVDNQDVIAEIVELARLKYLSITTETTKKIFADSIEYVFTQLKQPDKKLLEHQRYLLEHLFSAGSPQKLSDLKGTFYPHFAKTKELIAQSVADKKLFTKNPLYARGIGLTLVGLSLGASFVFLAVTNYLTYVPQSMLYLLATAPICFLIGYHMPRRTAMGTNYFLQARGLKQTINWGKWREEIKEKNLFIEEILPFAIALGVIGKLAKDMRALNIEPPKYAASFATHNILFANSFNSFSNTMNQSLSHNPSSSSWSGGSGFSGGGGGGGGGGSW